MNKSLANQISELPKFSQPFQPPTFSKPRCMCCNVYVQNCRVVAATKPWDCVCGTQRNFPSRTRCRNCGRRRGAKN